LKDSLKKFLIFVRRSKDKRYFTVTGREEMSEATNTHRDAFFCSWSGGKDSCLALYRSLKAGRPCAALFTMIDETGVKSRSHELSPDALAKQARAMGIPLRTASASWDDYETKFKEAASSLREEGILHGVFGDIDLKEHREWVERVCGEIGMEAHLPLWEGTRRDLVMEFLKAGFQALIVVVDTRKMPDAYLGRKLDLALIDELEGIGVDACGENGEFHTFVFDGPIFREKLELSLGAVERIQEYAYIPVKVN
jgi:diphthine-ammonia ligase